ncbi:unnamed protein product [Dicrocoelium dendriticum]|nr:unnamed protein product [Dicrocoelium dendriticum]
MQRSAPSVLILTAPYPTMPPGPLTALHSPCPSRPAHPSLRPPPPPQPINQLPYPVRSLAQQFSPNTPRGQIRATPYHPSTPAPAAYNTGDTLLPPYPAPSTNSAPPPYPLLMTHTPRTSPFGACPISVPSPPSYPHFVTPPAIPPTPLSI